MTTPTGTSALPALQLAAASVTGRDHQRLGRNNQDAWAAFRGARHLVAAVADGCGSAPSSEAGARLGAQLLVSALARRLEPSGPGEAAGSASPAPGPEALLEEARREVLDRLRALALDLCPSRNPGERELAAAVRDHLLFTLVGAVVGPEETVAFALGDGLLELNGEARPLGPFPDNEPPYLGYALLPERLHGMAEAALRLRIEARLPTAALLTLALGTDGAGELAAAGASPASLLETPVVFRNPDALRRRLSLLARERPADAPATPRLSDDTTLILLRRAPCFPEA